MSHKTADMKQEARSICTKLQSPDPAEVKAVFESDLCEVGHGLCLHSSH